MGEFQEENKKQDTGKFLFFVLGDFYQQCIYKLDLNTDFTATDFSLKGLKRRRRPLSPSSPSFHHYHFTVGRCNRYLTIKKRQIPPPLLPNPYLKLYRSRSDLQKDAAMVALGSKIFMVSGHQYVGLDLIASKDMFVFDIHHPDHVVKTAPMNYGKVCPRAWAIGGKIYVMPDPFEGDPPDFECFDPDSNSWTLLPSPAYPPSDNDCDMPKFDGVEILIDYDYNYIEPLSVSSHAVVGSSLIISLGNCRGVYAFDTAQPHKGWRRIFLSLSSSGPPLLLNFIPFRPDSSFPIRDLTIFSCHCHNRYSRFLDEFLQDRFKIGNGDSFVCSFGDLGSEFVKVSIARVGGVNVSRSRHEKFVERLWATKVAPLGDGLVLLSKIGLKNGKRQIGIEYGVVHYSFDIFRVEEEEEEHYVASHVSSTLFRAKGEFPANEIPYTFAYKDGAFTS